MRQNATKNIFGYLIDTQAKHKIRLEKPSIQNYRLSWLCSMPRQLETNISLFPPNFVGGAIAQRTKLTECKMASTNEAEQVVAFDVAKEALWLSRLVGMSGCTIPSLASALYIDNQGAISQIQHLASKRTEIRYNYV